jgi:catechol 2,3-dioxygenase-like lactoylglutathione lyase family enzyme
MANTFQVTFDCRDPEQVATFWADVLGYQLQEPPPGYPSWPAFLTAIGVPEAEWNRASAIVDPEGKGPRIFFQRVPEPKTLKNRVHLDVNVGGGGQAPLDERRARVDAAAARLAGLGATVLGAREEHDEYWVVMQDPEGNEFCLQ